MGRSFWQFGLTLGAGIVVGALGVSVLTAQPAGFSETVVLHTDVQGVDGRELIVSRLDTAPGWAHGRHYHAGHELVYVLEGTAILEEDGKPPVTLRPGMLAHVPPGQVHAGRNASRTAPFRFLLFRIHEKGQPLSVELG